MRRFVALVSAAAAALALTGSGAEASRTDTYSYVGGYGDVGAINCDGSLKVSETGIGGVCFDILRGDTHVSLSVDDDSGQAISITYSFKDAAGDDLSGYPQACGGAELTIPADAQSLAVYVDAALSAVNAGCPGAVGTTGTMTAVYS